MGGNLTGEGYCGHAGLYIILITIPILPICWIETFTILSYFTTIGSMIAVLSIALMVGYMWKIANKGGANEGDMKVFDFNGAVANFGIAVFFFEGNATVVNIWAECKNQSHYPYVLSSSVSTMLILTIAFSFMGQYVYK